eukprot:CAMPEP_0118877522 /NCGR_PEP_ID=MMETSP1163-20130328/17787_1 /TAXON_ID=124430 /ORGANISM="Phaeomonas parva, Strain CCMP2877" /LENGTH=266 /DNA_ID=CAMNT_0006813245 /DNA_START=467 /DNA_END=1267 /DNA_ORIENTATION=-
MASTGAETEGMRVLAWEGDARIADGGRRASAVQEQQTRMFERAAREQSNRSFHAFEHLASALHSAQRRVRKRQSAEALAIVQASKRALEQEATMARRIHRAGGSRSQDRRRARPGLQKSARTHPIDAYDLKPVAWTRGDVEEDLSPTSSQPTMSGDGHEAPANITLDTEIMHWARGRHMGSGGSHTSRGSGSQDVSHGSVVPVYTPPHDDDAARELRREPLHSGTLMSRLGRQRRPSGSFGRYHTINVSKPKLRRAASGVVYSRSS